MGGRDFSLKVNLNFSIHEEKKGTVRPQGKNMQEGEFSGLPSAGGEGQLTRWEGAILKKTC